MADSNLEELRSLEASSNENNSTCYWKTNEVLDKDASLVPFFLYFLIIFCAIRALKIIVDMRQLVLY